MNSHTTAERDAKLIKNKVCSRSKRAQLDGNLMVPVFSLLNIAVGHTTIEKNEARPMSVRKKKKTRRRLERDGGREEGMGEDC